MSTAETVSTLCGIIDRCGETTPLTTWWLAQAVSIDVDRAEELLSAVEHRTGKIMRFRWITGKDIWIRPEHEVPWTKKAAREMRTAWARRARR